MKLAQAFLIRLIKMSSEYIKISYPERIMGERNLLYAEMETLTSIKNLIEYKKIRRQELDLTLRLKSKIKMFNDTMKILDRMLPKITAKTQKTESAKLSESEIQEQDLESELEKIRQKLERIQAN